MNTIRIWEIKIIIFSSISCWMDIHPKVLRVFELTGLLRINILYFIVNVGIRNCRIVWSSYTLMWIYYSSWFSGMRAPRVPGSYRLNPKLFLLSMLYLFRYNMQGPQTSLDHASREDPWRKSVEGYIPVFENSVVSLKENQGPSEKQETFDVSWCIKCWSVIVIIII